MARKGWTAMDVPSLMRQAAQFYADRTAIITRDEILTYAEAWQRGARMANALIDAGVTLTPFA